MHYAYYVSKALATSGMAYIAYWADMYGTVKTIKAPVPSAKQIQQSRTGLA
jgi:hypothetical protein